MLIPRLPAKGLNAGLFFLVLPVVAFFLLHGGGLEGFGVSWTAGLLSGLADSIVGAGRATAKAGEAAAIIGPLLVLLGKLVVLIGSAISWLIWPLTWLRDQIQASHQPVWADFAATAGAVSIALFLLNGGMRAGLRPLITSLAVFAGIGIVIAVMGLDRGGFPVVDTRLWGGQVSRAARRPRSRSPHACCCPALDAVAAAALVAYRRGRTSGRGLVMVMGKGGVGKTTIAA